MLVKICGITNREDALAAVEGGAQALGFIFHPASPRYITPSTAAEWMDVVPRGVLRVGVFVNRPAAEVERIASLLNLDVAQLHGAERPDDVPQNVAVWKAFRVGAELDEAVHSFPADAVLLDGMSSGKTFDWKLARTVKRKVIVAGGLDEQNVAEAIEAARPWGVDACSSLEMVPGKKDLSRMARFLKACQPLLSI